MRGGTLGATAVVVLLVVLSGTAVGAAAASRSSPIVGPPAVLVTDELTLPVRATFPPLDPSTELSVTLTLPYSHSGELDRFLAAVEDPASPGYRHYLTASQFVDAFAPSSASRSSVTSSLAAAGATHVSVSASGAVVSAVLSARAVERLFGVGLVEFGTDGRLPLYTAVGTPTLPAPLRGEVVGIGGLSDAANPHLSLETRPAFLEAVPHGASSQFVLSNTSTEWFVGSDFTQAYGATDLFPNGTVGANATFPTRVAVATLLASGYNESADQNLPPWDPNVVAQYFNDSFPKDWPHPIPAGVLVSVDGIRAPAPGSLGTLNDSSLDEFENSLDLEMAGSLAPGASLYNFYFPGSLLAGNAPVGDLADDFAYDLGSALSFNYSPAHLGVVSGSFGLPDLNDSSWNSYLTEAAATGVTVVMASGDQGNAPNSLTGRSDGQWPDWPASAAFNTSGSISVGGVSVTLSGLPTTTWNGTSLNVSFDSNLSGFNGMSAWWDTSGCPTMCAGTEGGLSTVFPEPYWQLHSAAQPDISLAALAQGASALARAGPDVAFPANATIAYVYADSAENVYFTVLEGTSVAAPVFAGLLADVIGVENRSGLPFGLGYLDPEIYRMASYFSANPGPTSPFYDVTVGHNYVFSAGPGWDPTTGWGGLDTPLFLTADENPSIASYHYTGPTPGIPATSNAPIPSVTVYVIIGLGIVLAVLLVLVFAWPGRKAQPPAAPLYAPPGSTYGVGPPPAHLGPPGSTYGVGPPPAHLGPPGSTYGVAPPPPSNVYGLPPPAPSTLGHTTATFLCPYCGSVRPAEPVRCPRCGAL
jgi:subtilase family serine protease